MVSRNRGHARLRYKTLARYIGTTLQNRIIDHLRRVTVGRIIIENHDWRRTVFLAGTGRSGTTWLANAINYNNAYRCMFEPFHSKQVDILRHYNYRQYLRPNDSRLRIYEPAKAVLCGDVRSKWIDGYNRKIIVKKRLINDIRANLLLKWIKSNFPEIQIILLLRHPCAVAASKLKLNWETHLEDFLSQPELMEDHLSPFEDDIKKAETAFEKHIFLWCIENYVPLKQLQKDEYHLVFYERLCTKPESEIHRLFGFLDEKCSPKVMRMLSRPSATTRPESPIMLGKNLVESWRDNISVEQVLTTVDILKVFGLDQIYSYESIPH